MILVVSHEEDEHAMLVLERLAALDVPARLLDLAYFPQHLHLSLGYEPGGIRLSNVTSLTGDTYEFAEYRVIWWRRPQHFVMHPQISDPAALDFVQNECYSAFSGLWSGLDPFWINDPVRDDVASRKPYQLKVAQECGLEIPATLITSNPAHAHEFVERFGASRTIYKAFSASLQAWRETRLMRDAEVALLDNVRYAPVIFQEYIPAQIDLRITLIGDEVYPVAVYSQETAYRVDYRMDMDRAHIESCTLPPELADRLRAYKERLGLVYGAVDMRLTPDGRYVFLEINPSGQWLFMEERCGAPITDAFVRLLVERAAG